MNMKENKTKKALEMLAKDPSLTIYQAAKDSGITPTTLYAGVKRAQARQNMHECPCCGSKVEKFLVAEGIVAQVWEKGRGEKK
jgi:transposase-like protein